jgi:hypothetical protein
MDATLSATTGSLKATRSARKRLAGLWVLGGQGKKSLSSKRPLEAMSGALAGELPILPPHGM